MPSSVLCHHLNCLLSSSLTRNRSLVTPISHCETHRTLLSLIFVAPRKRIGQTACCEQENVIWNYYFAHSKCLTLEGFSIISRWLLDVWYLTFLEPLLKDDCSQGGFQSRECISITWNWEGRQIICITLLMRLFHSSNYCSILNSWTFGENSKGTVSIQINSCSWILCQIISFVDSIIYRTFVCCIVVL